MTTIPATQSATSTPPATQSTSATSGTSATVDYNEFLQLMIAEMQYQDPTNPTDPTQYMSQLASFSQVQQTMESNTTLNSMLTSSSLSQAESAIGRTLTSADGKTSGVVDSVSINSAGAATATLDNGQTLSLSAGVTVS